MNTKRNKKGREALQQALVLAVSLLAGGAFGFLIARFSLSEEGSAAAFVAVLCSAMISFLLHLILHEGGHLVLGLLSGYGFVSFRAGSVIFVKQGEKIVRRKFRIPGTGGQCLMDPPEPSADGTYPYFLYNLGGGLFNLLAGGAGAVILLLAGDAGSMLNAVVMPFSALGIYFGIVNLIPMKIGGIANDGYNIKSFKSSPESARAFWLQLRINRLQQTDGMRLSEMPASYFELPEGDFSGNPLMDAIRVMKVARAEDEQKFDEMMDLGRELLADRKLLGIYRNVISAEMLFAELIGPCRAEEVERLYDRSLKKYFKSVKAYPSTHRILYAWAVRFAEDAKLAEREKKAFEKMIKSYPTPGEIWTEQKLMEVI